MKKQNKGITLVALIITIIVLLILSGVAVSSLIGKDGMLTKISQAKGKSEQAYIKEEIELKIQEFYMEKAEQQKFAEVNLNNLNTYLTDKMKDFVVYELYENEMICEYKNHEISIDDKFEVVINGMVGIKPELTYELSTTELAQNELTIKIKSTIAEGTITSIIDPNGVETSGNELLYKVTENGEYRFMAKSSQGTKGRITIMIKNIKIEKPIISVIRNGLYPTITESGVVGGGLSNIEIKYDNNALLVNYYSEDNGVTWVKYNGPIQTTASKIIAKSVIKNDEGIVSDIAVQSIQKPSDALGANAYDPDETTYISAYHKYLGGVTENHGYMLVDENMIGKKFYIKTWCEQPGDYGASDSGKVTVKFFDSSNTQINSEVVVNNGGGDKTRSVTIPEGTVKILFSMTIDEGWGSDSGDNARIYNIYV